jgi:hypothetical protein
MAGVAEKRLRPKQLLARRLFPKRVGLPKRWQEYYDRTICTRRIKNNRTHDAKYAR